MRTEHSPFKVVLPLALVGTFLLLACNLSTEIAKPSATQNATGAGSSPLPSVGPAGTAEPALRAPITHLLTLRSVAIALQSTESQGGEVRVDAEVDADGNYHMKRTIQGDLPAGFPVSKGQPPQSTDLYVVSGSAYAANETGKLAQVDYSTWSSSLEGALRGFYGPGMWLLILPKGSLANAGAAAQGGFQTTKYSVNGQIEGASITGTIWMDQARGALVGAELQIPAELLGLPGKAALSPMKVSLQVTRTKVAPVSPPGLAAAQPTGGPAATGSPGASAGFSASQAGLPAGFPIYPGAHDFSGLPGQFVQFTVDADVRTVSDFYDKQMKAGGWSGYSTGGAMQGEGEGGPPAPTAGPTPTATPAGWMSENMQIWTKGSQQIVIQYTQHPGGGTDLQVAITGH